MQLDNIAWQTLGAITPRNLIDARLTAHWALQPVSALGTTLLPAADDDSHTNTVWLPRHGALAGRRIGHQGGLRAALRVADLTLLLLDRDDALLDSLPLERRGLADALEWLAGALRRRGGAPSRLRPLAWRDYELPAHPAASGAQLTVEPAALAELARWYGNADAVLQRVRASFPAASEVACWPHHFDIATLISLPGEGEDARTIGAGLSPGDDSYPEPYLYVTPSPDPDLDRLPPLAVGRWHTGGWIGAVLTGSEVVTGDGATQTARVAGFLRSALAAGPSFTST